MNIKSYITEIPNWPKAGVTFLDITPVLENPVAFNHCVSWLVDEVERTNATSLVAIESRGFIFASAAALIAQVPLVLVRKKNKLPGKVHTIAYDTEYSTDTLEIKTSANPGSRPLIVDDLVATGGTIIATADLLTKHFDCVNITAGAIINLAFLSGEQKITNKNIKLVSLTTYE